MPVAGTENILLLVLLAAAFYVLILRPQRTRARALREVRSSLAVAGSARRRRRRAGRATRCFRCQPRASPLRFGVRGQIARVRRTRRRAEEIAVRRGSGAGLRPSDKSPPVRQVSARQTSLRPSDKSRLRAETCLTGGD